MVEEDAVSDRSIEAVLEPHGMCTSTQPTTNETTTTTTDSTAATVLSTQSVTAKPTLAMLARAAPLEASSLFFKPILQENRLHLASHLVTDEDEHDEERVVPSIFQQRRMLFAFKSFNAGNIVSVEPAAVVAEDEEDWVDDEFFAPVSSTVAIADNVESYARDAVRGIKLAHRLGPDPLFVDIPPFIHQN
jgi:hypothetical protein